jgi:hypothetical protein
MGFQFYADGFAGYDCRVWLFSALTPLGGKDMPRPLRPMPLLGVLLAICPAVSAETTLFQYTTSTVGERGGRVDTVSFPINYFNRPETTLFGQYNFPQADVGRTVTATRASDLHFDAFTAMLTNGVDDEIAFNFYPAPDVNLSGVADHEPRVVWNDLNDPRVDLHGQVVGAYTLRIDQLTIYPPALGGFDARVTFSAISVPHSGHRWGVARRS